MKHRAAFLVVAGIVVVAVTACERADEADTGSEAADVAHTPAPAAPVAASSVDACALISAEELKSAAGVEGVGQKSTSGGADVCTWFGADGKAAIVQVYSTASDYEQSRSAFEGLYKKQAEDVSGVGERAFYIDAATGAIPTGTMSAVRGNRAVSVQIMGGSDAAARRREATALANTLLGKL